MNRRGFLSSLLATVALTTGLANARLSLVTEKRKDDIIELMRRKIRAAHADIASQLNDSIYVLGKNGELVETPYSLTSEYSWSERAVTITVRS